MDVIYLSVEAVEMFHERALQEHGGIDGLRSRDLLEAAVLQPQQSAFGDDAYQSIASKAAAHRVPECAVQVEDKGIKGSLREDMWS